MLENYLSKLLVSRFGRYLKLDNEKLRVAAWKGDVELHNIEVLADALSDTLDGPVRVVCGNVGHFHLHVPWAALGSRPVEIVIEDVTVLLAPVDTWGMDPRERRRRARYAKMMKVENKMFRYRQKENIATAAAARTTAVGGENPGPGFWQRLVTKVFYNVQVIVRRVHIRYEDSTTYPGRSMSLGLTLNEVLSQTADSDWNVSFSQVGSGRMHKLINIEDLGLYFDTLQTNGVSSQVGEGTDMRKVFSDNGNTRAHQQLSFQEEHDYILFPLSGCARLLLGQDDVFLDLSLPSMGMRLSTDQLTNVHAMRLALKDLERWVIIFRHRPLSPPTKDPRGWWKYAVWCIIFSQRGGVRRKLGWLDVAQLLRTRKEYVQLYKERLGGQLTPSDYQEYMRMEEELSVNEIVAFQKTAEAELARRSIIRGSIVDGGTAAAAAFDSDSSSRHPTQEEGGGSGTRAAGWLGTLFGYGKQKQLQQEDKTIVDIGELSEYERKTIEKEVVKAFSMDEPEHIGTVSRWSNLVAILSLNNATLTIVEGSTPCLRTVWDTKLHFSGLRRSGAWKINATLGGLHIFDPSIGGEHGLSTIVKRKRNCFNDSNMEVEETVQIGDFSIVETGAVTISYSHGGEEVKGSAGGAVVEQQNPSVDINLRIAAHEITYNPRCFNRTIAVFQSSELRAVINEARYRFGDVHSHAYIVASSFLRGLALSSEGGVNKSLSSSSGTTLGDPKFQKHYPEPPPLSPNGGTTHTTPSRTVFTASIHVEAPLIMFLETPDDLRVGKGQLLLIDLGCVTLSPNGHNKSGKDLGWGLNLSGVQVIVVPDAQAFLCNYGPSLSSIIGSSCPLVERLDLTLNLLPTIDPLSGRFKQLLISGDLPRLSIHLHSSTFHLLIRMLNVKLEENGQVKKEEDRTPVFPGQLMGGLPLEGGGCDNATELSSTTTTTSSFPVQQHSANRSELGGGGKSLDSGDGGLPEQDMKASLFEAVTEVEWMDELAEHEEREEQLRVQTERQVAVESENWGGGVIEVVFSLPLTLIHVIKDETLQQQMSSLSSSHRTEEAKDIPKNGCLLCTQLRQLTVQSSYISCARAESSTVSISLGGLLVVDEYQDAGVSFKSLMSCPSASSQFCFSLGQQLQNMSFPDIDNNDDLCEDTVQAACENEEVVGGAISFSNVGNAPPLLKVGFLQVNWNPETISNVVEFVSIIGEKLSGVGSGTPNYSPDRTAIIPASTLLPVSRIEIAGAIINLNKERERRHLATVELGPLSLESFPGSEIQAEVKGFCMSVNYGEDICHEHWCELVRGSKACLTVGGGGKSSENGGIHNKPPFCLELLNSCVVYMQQPWLECLDYISCAVLGPAILKPWLFTAAAEADSTTTVHNDKGVVSSSHSTCHQTAKERTSSSMNYDPQMVSPPPVDPVDATASSSSSSDSSSNANTQRQHQLNGSVLTSMVLSVTASDLRLIIPCSNISNDGIEAFTPVLSVELRRQHDGRGTLWKMSIKDAHATFFQRLSSPTEATVQFRTNNNLLFSPYSTVVTGVGIVLHVESNNGKTNFTGTVTGGADLKITLQDLKSLREILRENFGAKSIGSCLYDDPVPPLCGPTLPPRIVYNYAKLGSRRGVYVASIRFVDVRLGLANKVVVSNQDDNLDNPYDYSDNKRSKTSDELIARISCDCLTWNISWPPNERCLGIKLECPRFLMPTANKNNNRWGKEGLLLCPYPHNKGNSHHPNSHSFVYFETRWFTQETGGDTILPSHVVYKIELSEVCVMAEKEKWAKIIQILSSTSSMSYKDEESIQALKLMRKFTERSMSTTSTSTSISSSVFDLETHKAMVVIVDPTSSMPPMSDWSEGDALIGICNTAHLKTHLPFTSGYSGAPCHRSDDNGTDKKHSNGDDEESHNYGLIKVDIEEAEAYCVSLKEVGDILPSDRTTLMDAGIVVPDFHISAGRCLLSWQENCGICVEYEKQYRNKQRFAHCYTVKVSVSNEECSGPKLECSVTDVALLRLALSNLIFGSSHDNGAVTSFQNVAEPEPEPESVTIVNISCDSINFGLIDDSGLYFDDSSYTTAVHDDTEPVHLVACVLLRDFSFKRMENGDVFVECALLSVLDCLQSARSSMLYLVQCPGSVYMTILSGIDELRGVRERKLTIELPDSLRVNWNPQTLAALWQLGAAFKLSWMATAVCVPPSSRTRYARGGVRQFVRLIIVDALECEAKDVVYSQRLEIENFNSITGSGRPNPLDWGEHRTWAVEERNQKSDCKLPEAVERRVLSLIIILGKHTGIYLNKEVGDYCVLDLVVTDGGRVSMMHQPNGDMDFNGQFMDVLISDPRASLGSLYSDIVTAPIVIFNLSIGTTNENISPSLAVDGNQMHSQNQNSQDRNKRRPYKKFSLQLLSGPRVIYIQQLWLESLDYIMNGILGPALWGNAVAPDGQNNLLEWLRARDGCQPIGSSQLEVWLENVTCLVPHSPEAKAHILGRLSSLQFLTWVECEEVIDDEDGRRTFRGCMSPCQESSEEKDLSKRQESGGGGQSDAAQLGKGDRGGENDDRETTIQMVHGSSVKSAVMQVRHTRVEVPSLKLEADNLEDGDEQRRHLLGPLKLVVSMSNPSGWDSEVLAESLSTELRGDTTPLHALCIHISLFPLEGTSSNCQPTTTTSERGAMGDGGALLSSPLVIQLNKWSLGVLLAVLRHNLSAHGFNGLDTASLWAEGRRNPCRNIILHSNLKWAAAHLNNGNEMMVGSLSCCSSCNESFTYLVNPYYCCGCGGLKCRQCLTSGTVACVHPSVVKVGGKSTFPTAALLCQFCAGQAFESLRSRSRSRVRFGFGCELPKSRPIAVQLNIDAIECFILELGGGPPGSSSMSFPSSTDHHENNDGGPLKQGKISSHLNHSLPAPIGNAANYSKQHAIAVIALEGLSVKFSRGAQRDYCLGIIANIFIVTSLRQDVIHSKLITSQNYHFRGNGRYSMYGTSNSSSDWRRSSNPNSSPQQSSDDGGGVIASRPDVELTMSKSNVGIRKLDLVTNQTQVTLAPREWMSILTAFQFTLFEGILQVSDLAELHRVHYALVDGSFLDYILKLASRCTTSTTTIETAEGDEEDKRYGYTSYGVISSSIPPPEYHAHAVLYDFKVIVLEDESSSITNAIALQGLVVTQYLCGAEPLPPGGEEEGSSHTAIRPGLLKENALVSHETNLKVQDLYLWVLVKMECNSKSEPQWYEGAKQQLDGVGERCNASEFCILEPISISVDIIGIEYPFQPFTQRITCDFSRIISQFSYRDLKIVEGIMTGWLTSFNMMKKNIGKGGGGLIYKTSKHDINGNTSDRVATSRTPLYNVVFKTKTLGIVLRKEGGMAVLEAADPEVIRNAPQLYSGNEVAAIAGQLVISLSYESIIELIKSHSTRPLCITFRRSVYSWRDVGVREYVVVHKLGNELEGIKICAGGIGNQAVVMHVPKDWKPQDIILQSEEARIHEQYRPHPGSVLMSVNGISTDTHSVSETWKLIQSSRRPIRVRYREISSSAWPQCLVQLELACPHINATVMDGHDAASLMLEMLGVVVTGESGPGVQRQLTRHKDPRHPFNQFAKNTEKCVVDPNIVVEDKKEISSLGSQSQFSENKISNSRHQLQRKVLMARRLDCNVEVQLLYYNSRVSAWEPFLEPTTFRFGYEDATPMLFECTCRLKSTTTSQCYDWSNKGGGLSAIHVTCSQDLCMNVTDSVLERFRTILQDRDNFFVEQHVERPLSHPYAPFVIQNRTEFPLEFWVHNKKISNIPISFDAHHYHPLRDIKCHYIGPFSDCQFVSDHVVMRNGKGGAAATETGTETTALPTNHFHHLRKGSGDIALHVSIRFSSIGEIASPLASKPLLNLPLQHVGIYGLSCFLGQVDSALPFDNLSPGGLHDDDGDEKINNSGLEKVGLVWEVHLESSQRVLTLKSAIEILNMTGDDLQLKCSSSPFLFDGRKNNHDDVLCSNSNQATTTAVVQQDSGERKEEVLGIIHPGETFALPLGWSNVKNNNIYIQPTSLPGRTYDYCDCSLLLPSSSPAVAGAGDPNTNCNNGSVFVHAVSWTKCTTINDGDEEETDSSSSQTDASATALPLFFFVNALNHSTQLRGYINDSSVPTKNISSMTTSGERGLLPPQTSQRLCNLSSNLPFRPVLVEIYSCLLIRNALPLPLAYQVCTIVPQTHQTSHRDDVRFGVVSKRRNGNVIATGILEPGAVKHIYEANILIGHLDISYQVSGFDWTIRQRLEKPGNNNDNNSSTMDGDGDWEYMKCEVLVCHNSADQLLYLSMEATSPRPNCLSLVLWTDFWIRNLSGLPVIIGEPVLHMAPDGTLLEESKTKTMTSSRKKGGGVGSNNFLPPPKSNHGNITRAGVVASPGKSSKRHQGTLVDANLAPVQSSSVLEEVFEIYLTSTDVNTWSGVKSYFARTKKKFHFPTSTEDHLWCTDSGQPYHAPQNVRLPDDRWTWVSNWDVDFSGKVSPDGWESCSSLYRRSESQSSIHQSKVKSTGRLSYGSDMFTSQRVYNETEPMHRRRWFRLRMLKGTKLEELYKKSLSTYGGGAAAEGISLSSLDGGSMKEESKRNLDNTDTSSTRLGVTVYQPTSSLLSMSDTHREHATICIKIGDSAWSDTLPIGIQGCGGALEIPGTRWPQMVDVQVQQQPKDNRLGGSDSKIMVTPCPLYELSYNVTVPSSPWNKARIITIASRYAIVNKSQNLCFLAQQEGTGGNGTTRDNQQHCTSLLLPPGSSNPLHWSDRNLEQRLCLTIAAGSNSDRKDPSYLWSGGISVENIGSFPVLVRSTQDIFSSSMAAALRQQQKQQPLKHERKEMGSGGYAIKEQPVAVPYMTLDGEGLSLPCSKVVNVTVTFGDLTLKGMGSNNPNNVQQMATISNSATAAVHIIVEEEGIIGGPAPSFRLENHSPITIYYAQCGVSGPGDMLPTKSQCLFGWDIPCPTDLSNLKVYLSTAPFNSQSGKRMARSINLHKLGDMVDMEVERDGGKTVFTIQAKIVPDGPTKVAHIKYVPVPDSSLVTASRAFQFLTNQKKWVDDKLINPRMRWHLTPSALKVKQRKALTRVGPQSTPYINSPPRTSSNLIPYSDSSSDSSSAPPLFVVGDMTPSVTTEQHGDNKMNKNEDKDGQQPHQLSSTFEGCSKETAEHLWVFHMFLNAVRVSVVDTAIPESSNLTMMGSSRNNLLDNWKGRRRINESSSTCCYDSGEILLGSIVKVSVSIFGRKDTITLQGGIKAIKIDNYMPRSPYPILLQTTSSKVFPSSSSEQQQQQERPGLKSVKDDVEGPCLELRTTLLRNVTNMVYFKKFFLKLKTMDLNLDEDVVNWAQSFIDRAVVDVSTDSQPGELEHWTLPHEALAPVSVADDTWFRDDGIMDSSTTTTQKDGMSTEMTTTKSKDTVMYFDLLYVAPIKVRLSFQCPMRKAKDIYSGIKPVQLLLDIMMKVTSSHITLDKFVVTHETIGRSQFLALCRAHYLRKLKYKAFSVLGYLEALGNPVGLFRDMGQGMQDFVAEPVIGLVKSVEEMRPNKFFAGVARGGGSLLKNTAGGVANSASMITGTFSDILVSTMDSRYQRDRAKRDEERGSKPRDMLQGIGTGGMSLVQGFSDGVTGVFVNPYKGAEKDGLAGFARGVGTGVIGLVVKPVVGIGDAATNVLQGVKGTTETIAQSSSGQVESNASFCSMDLTRVGQLRPRRALYGHHRILRRYCLEDAQVASLLATLPQLGRSSSSTELSVHNGMEAIRSDGVMTGQSGHSRGRVPEQYIAHIDIGSGVVVLTQSNIIMFDTCHEVAFQEDLGIIVGVEVDEVSQSHVHRLIIYLRTTMAATTPAEDFAMKEGITLPPSPEDLQVMDETAPGLGGGSSRRVFNRVIECPTSEKCQQLAMLLENAITDRPLWLL